MRPFLFSLIIYSFIGCQLPKNKVDDPSIDSAALKREFMYDTLAYVREVTHDLANGDSVSYIYQPIAYIEVPQSSKRVKFYSIDFVNGGDAYLSIITEDDKTYQGLEVKNSSVASVLSILKHDYVRIDTINLKKLRFYVYKTNPEQILVKPLKAF